jgi:hypothetical protein
MEEGQRGDHDVGRSEVEERAGLGDAGDQVPVAQQYSLRKPGCASGVEDGRNVARVDRAVGHAVAVRKESPEGFDVVDHDDVDIVTRCRLMDSRRRRRGGEDQT